MTRGRPRTVGADEAILEATERLLRELGYVEFSVEDVARAAGVGRQSVYRRWPSKAQLVVAAMAVHAAAPLPETGSLAGDLRAAVDAAAAAWRGVRGTAEVYAAIAADAAATAAFRESFLAPRRAGLAAVLARHGVEVDATVVQDLLAGPFLHRVLTGGEVDAALADAVAGAVLTTCGGGA